MTPPILIPAATPAYRLRSIGPRLLIQLGSETLLERHLRILHKTFPESLLLFVLGFGASRVQKKLPKWSSFILNEEFEETGSGYSVSLGLKELGEALLVEGDLIFEPKLLGGLDFSTSFVLYGPRKEGVGLLPQKGLVSHFDFGLPWRWLGVAYLARREADLFQRAAAGNGRKMTFELFNEVISLGGSFRAVEGKGFLAELDSIEDLRSWQRRS